jgi:hypothetical protein
MGALALGALGIVYGDIGTSPLYAFREAFEHHHLDATNEVNALGVVSIAFWALVIIISIKYLTFMMRADNHGEGGILALTAMIMPKGAGSRKISFAVALGIFGTALLYGGCQRSNNGPRQFHHSDRGRNLGSFVLGAKTRNWWHRSRFWTNHGFMVRHVGSSWSQPSDSATERAQGS